MKEDAFVNCFNDVFRRKTIFFSGIGKGAVGAVKNLIKYLQKVLKKVNIIQTIF